MNKLERLIKNHILQNGPVTFADFMNLAQYHPQLGYYRAEKVKIGKEGDFYTSPHVSAAFGEIIGTFIEKVIGFLKISDFTILELGAGKGYLALDILNYLSEKTEFYPLINYIIIDKNTDNCTLTLENHRNKIKIYNNISELEKSFRGVVISNELFDSLPFHRIIYQSGQFSEIYVDCKENKFEEISSDLSTENIKKYLKGYNLKPVDSKQIEVNLLAEKVIKAVSSYLDAGYMITIDYGYLFEEYFNNQKINGSFRCFYKHKINDNPYINIGQQDITADVDFTNLIRSGNQYGLNKVKYTTQGQFLVDWGILNVIERETRHGQGRVNSIKNLFLPSMMGNYFKVLLQSKNIPNADTIYPESNLTISFGID